LLGPFYWPLPTIYLEGKPKYNHISSTLIRDMAAKNKKQATQSIGIEQLHDLIPAVVARQVAELYSVDITKKDS